MKTDHDLDDALGSYLREGPTVLPDRVVERTLQRVRVTRQHGGWRHRPSDTVAWIGGHVVRAAVVTLVGVLVVALAITRSGLLDRTGRVGPGSAIVGASPTSSLTPTPTPTPRTAPVVVGDTTLGTIPATKSSWKIRTPRLTGSIDPVVLSAVNGALATGAARDLAAFRTGPGAQAPVDAAQSPNQLVEDFTVALVTPDLVSLRVSTYVYPSGAAHGGTTLGTWTFDLRTGRRLALADLFLPGAHYLDTLAAVARAALMPEFGTDSSSRQWVTTGTAPSAANYAAWALTPSGLEITFAQYQVAYYAAGMPAVVIPWPALAGMLDPAGPVAPLLVASPGRLASPSASSSSTQP